MAMQGMMEEVKRLTAGPAEVGFETVHARDASALPQPSAGVMRTETNLTELDPLQQAGQDARLKYAQAHGPGAPMPAGLPGPWTGTGAAPLKPIHYKDN